MPLLSSFGAASARPYGRFVKGPLGTSPSNPFITSSQISATYPSGVYYVSPSGYNGNPIATYVDNTTTGGQWMLAMVVTNVDGDTVDWFDGDSWNGTNTTTDHFTTISTLNTSFLTGLNKKNAKHPLTDYYAFNQMMIREDYSGTIGTKAYNLNRTASLRARWTDGTDPVDSLQTYNNQVSSIIGTTGTMGGTFTTNTLDFNYTLTNDGARISATDVISEAVGGISARVDNGRNYAWRGNLTRSDGGRNYNSDGTTTDHTVWIFVR